ncbi:MAG: hypothetical protein IJC58_08010 [Oscillospiraceae bacterium]|nr:hypothetical protein [Oscillospiraceae bacterium]
MAGQYKTSRIRKVYIARLVGRCAVLVCAVALYILRPEMFGILQGFAFFEKLSVFHLLWLVWMLDMLFQLIPAKDVALGSHKHMRFRFRPVLEKINPAALKNHIVTTTRAAYKVFIIWALLIAALGALRIARILTDAHLFLVSVLFYVCDLICVLIWCPFRLIMKNKCCTTCRIFNWDHLMMFTPMLFVRGFYSVSLLLFSFAVWLVWELCVMMYPERFWEGSNMALKCSECTDKLCTQYCMKLRGRKS